MKIWLLTSEFPPVFGGGISTYCLETARMFFANGHDVTVITHDFKVKKLTKKKSPEYTVVRFNPTTYNTSSFLGYEANLSFAFARVVKELVNTDGAPDIIESQEYMGIAYYLLQYKWLQYPVFKDLKVLVTLHAPSFLYLEYNKVPHYQLPYFWVGEMERFCIRAADMIISPSNYLVNELKGRVETKDLTIHVVRNPYKVDEVKTPSFTKNEIVFFGKLTPQKGCLELIRYFKELWNEGFKHSLVMVGGGDHLYHPVGKDMIRYIRKQYKTEIESGLLKMKGSVSPRQIDHQLENAHVIIIPSLVDNLPYTVLEAMGRKKMVLASVQGGQSEVIEDGVDGFLFDHKKVSSFKEKLNHILSLPENAIKETGQLAFEKISQSFSYGKIYSEKIALLHQLAEKKEKSAVFPLTRPFADRIHSHIVSGKEPLLSVIIPYYNMAAHVEECVRSVVNSGYKNLEVIIVDDGSTEAKTGFTLNHLAAKYKTRIVTKKNEGLALARNTGALHAKGDYIAFLDPDDTVMPDYYEKAMRVLTAYDNIYFVGCWAQYFGNDINRWPAFNPEPPYLLYHNMINSSALVYRKKAFIDTGMNDPEMVFGMEDYESVINMVGNGYPGVVLPELLWNYRVRKNSMARAFTKNKQVYLYRLIAEKHKNFYSIFASEIVNLLNANGPGFSYNNPTVFNDLPGNEFISSKVKTMITNGVKSNRLLRKVAIKIKSLK